MIHIKFNNFIGKVSSVALQTAIDISSILLSFAVQFLLVFSSGFFNVAFMPDITLFISGAIVVEIYFLSIFWLFGLYKDWYVRSPFDEFFTILKSVAFGCLLIVFFIFVVEKAQAPRMMFFVYSIILALSVWCGRLVARIAQKNLRIKGIVYLPTLLIGSSLRVKKLYDKLLKSPAWGYKPIGAVLSSESELENWRNNYESYTCPALGVYDGFAKIIDESKPLLAILSQDKPDHDILGEILEICNEKNVTVKIEPDLYSIFSGQTKTLQMYGAPFIEVNQELMRPWEKFIKRAFDIVFSLCVLIIGLPVWILVAVIVKLESPGPFLYSQMRIGKDNKPFRIFKFRSMRNDVQKEQKWTVVNDPRVTKFGKFIRKTHLDEIPQFYNVLIGEMSIVGPRPEQPKFVDKFIEKFPYYKRRHKVRPGITGWWQIQYTVYEETDDDILNRIKMDFYYIENISLRLDIEIIFGTVFAVLKGHGQA